MMECHDTTYKQLSGAIEQRDLVEDAPAYGMGVGTSWSLKVPSSPRKRVGRSHD